MKHFATHLPNILGASALAAWERYPPNHKQTNFGDSICTVIFA